MVELVHYVLRRFLAKCLSEKALRGARNLAQKVYNSDLELKADRLDVTTTLTKIINGKPAVSDALKNEQTINVRVANEPSDLDTQTTNGIKSKIG